MELIKKFYKFVPLKIEDKFANATKYVANYIDYDMDELLMCSAVFGEEAQL